MMHSQNNYHNNMNLHSNVNYSSNNLQQQPNHTNNSLFIGMLTRDEHYFVLMYLNI